MNDSLESFWISSNSHVPEPALQGTHRTDVAVIGGGLTGLSAAYHLKQKVPGLRVSLIEQETIGSGASGRSTGIIRTTLGFNLKTLISRFGRPRITDAHQWMRKAMEYTRSLIQDHALDCDYKQTGCLRFATTSREVDYLLHEMELAGSVGINNWEWLAAGAVRQEILSPVPVGAIVDPDAALIDPLKLSLQLFRLAQSAGVKIFEHSPAIHVYETTPIRIETREGEILAEKVIFATNGYSARIPQLQSRQMPAQQYSIATRPLTSEELGSIGFHESQCLENARNFPVRLRLTADNRLVVSGGNISLDSPGTGQSQKGGRFIQALIDYIGEVFPSLKYIDITHKWRGSLSLPVDTIPQIGLLNDHRIAYSLGYAGHGIPLAIFAGRIITDLVRERSTELTDNLFVNHRMIPWPLEPLRFGLGRILQGYFRLKDSYLEKA